MKTAAIIAAGVAMMAAPAPVFATTPSACPVGSQTCDSGQTVETAAPAPSSAPVPVETVCQPGSLTCDWGQTVPVADPAPASGAPARHCHHQKGHGMRGRHRTMAGREGDLVAELKRIERIAEQANERIANGGARNGRSALIRIKQRAADAVRHARETVDDD